MSNCCRCSLCNRDRDRGTFANNNLSIANLNSMSNSSNDCDACSDEDLIDALCNLIGKRCNCEFTTSRGLESKCGTLERVGSNFIVLRSLNSNRLIHCRICDLIFVTTIC